MKTAPAALFAAAALIFASVSCDKHAWEETQVLHEGMHKAHGEGHGHGDEHHGEKAKDAHGAADAHAKPAHSETKEAAKH